MENKPEGKKPGKGFFAKLLDKLDKKMQEKAESGSCCCNGNNKEDKKSCCN